MKHLARSFSRSLSSGTPLAVAFVIGVFCYATFLVLEIHYALPLGLAGFLLALGVLGARAHLRRA